MIVPVNVITSSNFSEAHIRIPNVNLVNEAFLLDLYMNTKLSNNEASDRCKQIVPHSLRQAYTTQLDLWNLIRRLFGSFAWFAPWPGAALRVAHSSRERVMFPVDRNRMHANAYRVYVHPRIFFVFLAARCMIGEMVSVSAREVGKGSWPVWQDPRLNGR